MFEQLPSLRGFQPKFYSGGVTRFHLPLFYDLIAGAKPKRVLVVGFGDGQAFFTFARPRSNSGSIANASPSGANVPANPKLMMRHGATVRATVKNSTERAPGFSRIAPRPWRQSMTAVWMFC